MQSKGTIIKVLGDYHVKHCPDGVYRVYSNADDLICECMSFTNAIYQCERAEEIRNQQEFENAFNELNNILDRLISLESCQENSEKASIFDSIHFMKSELEKYNSCYTT